VPPKRRKPYRVFVSHATADKAMANTICAAIDAIPGATTFRDDRDIAGGENIPQTIRGAIRRSDQLLVLLRPTSIMRPWVILEIGMAYGLGKRIVPICYNVEMDTIDLLAMTKAYRFADLEAYLNDLRRRVRLSRRKA
jgi:hypothetical protein